MVVTHNGGKTPNDKRFYALLGLVAFLAMIIMVIILNLWGNT